MGLGITTSGACLPGVFWVCSFLFVTIWVAPENRARELRTRGSTVLTQDSQGSQMVGLFTSSKRPSDFAHRLGSNTGVRPTKTNAIQRIESLCAELQLERFPYLEMLEDRHIQIVD